MRVATIAALLFLSLTVTATRLSVFREEVNGVPGRTYFVVHGDDAPAPVPGGFEWLSRQMALLRAVQTHMMLTAMPDLPSTMGSTEDGADDTLRRVRCQRMRQAMLDEEQDVWQSAFGGDSSISAARPEPDMAEDFIRPASGYDNRGGMGCIDERGELVPCNSYGAVGQDDAAADEEDQFFNLAADPFDATALGPRTTDATTSTDAEDLWVASTPAVAPYPFELDPADPDPADGIAVPRQLQPADSFDDPLSSAAAGSDTSSGFEPMFRGSNYMDDDQVRDDAGQWERDGEGDDGMTPFEEPQAEWQPWDEEPEQPLGGSAALAVFGMLCLALVTVGAAVLLVLLVVRRRRSPYGDVDAVLVAPLLAKGAPAVKVCGIKVAAQEAQRDAVQGIDTSAALLKGQALDGPR